ncbi:hypothetical protein GCM10010398_61110 [Streptomyces fimbriatus]
MSTAAEETDPCTLQQGSAGVLAVLTRYYELSGDPRLPEVISTAGHWIARRTGTSSVRPGLHFGGRGTPWALYDAGRATDAAPFQQTCECSGILTLLRTVCVGRRLDGLLLFSELPS